MNIELRFLQKAIGDKNYISFKYEDKTYKSVKPLKVKNIESKEILTCEVGTFDFDKVKKLVVLKDRF